MYAASEQGGWHLNARFSMLRMNFKFKCVHQVSTSKKGYEDKTMVGQTGVQELGHFSGANTPRFVSLTPVVQHTDTRYDNA